MWSIKNLSWLVKQLDNLLNDAKVILTELEDSRCDLQDELVVNQKDTVQVKKLIERLE